MMDFRSDRRRDIHAHARTARDERLHAEAVQEQIEREHQRQREAIRCAVDTRWQRVYNGVHEANRFSRGP